MPLRTSTTSLRKSFAAPKARSVSFLGDGESAPKKSKRSKMPGWVKNLVILATGASMGVGGVVVAPKIEDMAYPEKPVAIVVEKGFTNTDNIEELTGALPMTVYNEEGNKATIYFPYQNPVEGEIEEAIEDLQRYYNTADKSTEQIEKIRQLTKLLEAQEKTAYMCHDLEQTDNVIFETKKDVLLDDFIKIFGISEEALKAQPEAFGNDVEGWFVRGAEGGTNNRYLTAGQKISIPEEHVDPAKNANLF